MRLLQNGPRWGDIARFAAALRGRRRLSVVRAAADGVWIGWTLRRRGVRPLLPAPNAPGGTDLRLAHDVSAAVDTGLAVVPLKATCLRRSIGLVRELSRLGLHGTLHIGVRRVGNEVEAHAWVRVGETVVNDDAALVETYSELTAGKADELLTSFR